MGSPSSIHSRSECCVNTSALLSKPDCTMDSFIFGQACTLTLLIPNYRNELIRFYDLGDVATLNQACKKSGNTLNISHFGLEIAFNQAQQLHLHDQESRLNNSLKKLITEFGMVIVSNAFLSDEFRDMGHRNRFPHLRFHRDRNQFQPTPYSLFTRNPFDQEQREPRLSSTLFTTNIVAHLQCIREKKFDSLREDGVHSAYDLFQEEDMSHVLGKVVAEHRWDKTSGTGEISMLDNRTLLHASYERQLKLPGYRIGVRYLC